MDSVQDRPYDDKAREFLAKRTKALMSRRNKLDTKLMAEARRKNFRPSELSRRRQLLKQESQLATRERGHIRDRLQILQQLKELHILHPTKARAADYDYVLRLLLQFKRHLGPMWEGLHRNIADAKMENPKSGALGDGKTQLIVKTDAGANNQDYDDDDDDTSSNTSYSSTSGSDDAADEDETAVKGQSPLCSSLGPNGSEVAKTQQERQGNDSGAERDSSPESTSPSESSF
jgi:hypothetical protein